MPLNSVNTNIGAQVALQSLNKTADQLSATQKRISTGFRVADASDDGAAFAVAQRVRSDVGALTSVNQQLGNAKGLVGTAQTGLTSISDTLTEAKALLVKIADNSVPAAQRDDYLQAYGSLVQQVSDTAKGATYNGQSLLDGSGDKTVINNEVGATSKISGADVSGLANTLAGLAGGTFDPATGFAGPTGGADADANSATAQAAAASALAAGGGFQTAQTGISKQLNQIGADSRLLDATVKNNSAKIDSLNAGLGALVDADLSKESANLQALQIRQQLGTQALSLANQAPQSLLSLFR